MTKSAVGAIIGPDGAVRRVVVTEPWNMRCHVGKDERVYIVPGLLVKEPVPWGLIPSVIKQAEQYAAKRAK